LRASYLVYRVRVSGVAVASKIEKEEDEQEAFLRPGIGLEGGALIEDWSNLSITGVLDERSLVYMLRSGRPYSPSDDKAVGSIILLAPKLLNRESQGQMKAKEWT